MRQGTAADVLEPFSRHYFGFWSMASTTMHTLGDEQKAPSLDASLHPPVIDAYVSDRSSWSCLAAIL